MFEYSGNSNPESTYFFTVIKNTHEGGTIGMMDDNRNMKYPSKTSRDPGSNPGQGAFVFRDKRGVRKVSKNPDLGFEFVTAHFPAKFQGLISSIQF